MRNVYAASMRVTHVALSFTLAVLHTIARYRCSTQYMELGLTMYVRVRNVVSSLVPRPLPAFWEGPGYEAMLYLARLCVAQRVAAVPY